MHCFFRELPEGARQQAGALNSPRSSSAEQEDRRSVKIGRSGYSRYRIMSAFAGRLLCRPDSEEEWYHGMISPFVSFVR